MNIFQRFLLGKEEEQTVELPTKDKTAEDKHSLVPSETVASSMREPDSGASTPQSGRSSDGDCVIEILSSGGEEGSLKNDDDGKEMAVVTTGKAGSPSPLEATKSLSVTATDSDEDGDEGKENAAAAAAKPTETNASDCRAESPQSVTGNVNSKLFKPRKRRRKRVRDSKGDHSATYLSPSSSNANRTTNRHKRRKDAPQETSNLIRIRIGGKSDNDESPSDSPTETQSENENQEATRAVKTSKRQENDASLDTMSENKKEKAPADLAEADEKLTRDKAPSPADPVETNQVHNPFDSNGPKVDSPSKMTMFKLPPELAPFNKPGVCDYGVIRASRLRNRKKTSEKQDVLYQNIQGQRRCRATKDGKRMVGEGNTNRCVNCAEGIFKYCHSHRNLCDEQKFFWEQRKRRDAQIGSSASFLRSKFTEMKKPEPKPQPMLSAARANIFVPNPRLKCVEAGEAEPNNARRCVFLLEGRGRCSRPMFSTQPGFCYGHTNFAQFLKPKRDEIFKGQAGAIRCSAVTKVGDKCRFKAVGQCVFCAKHTAVPPEKAFPLSYIVVENVKKEGGRNVGDTDSMNFNSMGEPTKGSSRKRGQKSLTMGSNIASTHSLITKQSKGKASRLKSIASNVMGKAKGRRKRFPKSNSDSSLAESNEVPKNIEFRRNIDFSAPAERATSFDDMCFNVYKSKRCWLKRAEGSILCHKCIVCHEEGIPFDHILNDDTQGDESILFSSQCVKFEQGKQCENMAVKGKILCKECIVSTKYGYSGGSGSEAESRSKNSDSDSSSSATFSSSEDSQDSLVSDDTDYDAYCMAYTHKEFFKMWKNWEKKTERMDEVEDSRLIKRANNTMSPTDTDGQVKAQYGRVLPHAMKKMIKILELRREDVFLDIGHGVGNTCLHASFCIGCDSRGIEVVSDRHEIADKFRGGMYAEHNGREEPRPEVGKVDLRVGRLEDPDQKEFLTKGITRAYVNNFNGVFAERSSKNKDKWFLDDYISGIFASMAPGAIMVTFHPLNLGLDRESSNSLRSKHNLEQSDHASYYDSEKILLGQAFCSVKWNKRSGNTNKIYVYKYRRLHQPGHHDAVFLCSNPTCKLATDMVPIPATTVNEDGRCVINHCKCKFSPKNLRKRGNNKQTSP